jgi:DNA-binding FrmR family transcriptional regulator
VKAPQAGITLDRESEKDQTTVRLRRVEGQIRGIQRMIEKDRDCEAIVTQLMAARAALDRASLYIMTHHIDRCLRDPDGQTSRVQLERLMAFFLKLSGVMPPDEAQAEDAELSAQPD